MIIAKSSRDVKLSSRDFLTV